MKYFPLVILLLVFKLSFGDAGNSYRFNLRLISNAGDTIQGYLYHNSYDNFNKFYHQDDAFKSFLQKEEVSIFEFIMPIRIGDVTKDATSKAYIKKVNLNEIKKITIIDFLEFNTSDRLLELSPEAFNIIKPGNPECKFISNQKVSTNCQYVLLSWKKRADLDRNKKEFTEKLMTYSKDMDNNKGEFNSYLEAKKKRLLYDGILLIYICESL